MTPEFLQIALTIIQVLLVPLVGYATQQLRSLRADIRRLDTQFVELRISLAKVNGRIDKVDAWQDWHEALFTQKQRLTSPPG